jgi:hypothetical protein
MPEIEVSCEWLASRGLTPLVTTAKNFNRLNSGPLNALGGPDWNLHDKFAALAGLGVAQELAVVFLGDDLMANR